MTIYLCRDYPTQNTSTANRNYIYAYALAIFLRRILGYTYVGDTNYNINTVGPLLIATGDATPSSSPSFPSGSKAGINLGAQREFYVSIPSAVRTVSAIDIGRVLVLKSPAYPRFNSGLFIIIGFETSTNSYVVDYRTLGEFPPVEAADSIQWYLYEKDISCPGQGGVNGKPSTQYQSDLTSNTPRIILQSPHALGWQVRICNEGTGDVATSLAARNCMTTTVSPGFGGTAAGDFPAFGQHFHAPMWFNSGDPTYLGGAPGIGDGGGVAFATIRITIVGDDTGQGVTMMNRNATGALTTNLVTFGLPENEPATLPITDYSRLFCIGSGYGDANSGVNGGSLLVRSTAFATGNFSTGMSASSFGVPMVAAASMWAYVTGTTQGNGPEADSSASDTPYVNATELLLIDVVQGTLGSWGAQVVNVYPYAPKSMGTIPHIRLGRSNFGDYTITTDPSKSYQHLRRGLYIPWGGPNLIP